MAIANEFVVLITEDNSWQALISDWEAQCAEFGEDFDNYAPATLKELGDLAELGHPRAAVYALKDGDNYVAVCQANCVGLPGYDGPVLRIRFMTVSPRYDFGDVTLDQYAELLVAMFAATVSLSTSPERQARHIKFHLRSPADRQFFAAVGQHLDKKAYFESVKTRGSWLYVTKSK